MLNTIGGDDTLVGDSEVEIIYDGQCPLCSAYFKFQRLRENGLVPKMVDARDHPEVVADFSSRGVDLNRDFVLRYRKVEYVGGEAMFVLASLGARNNLLRRVNGFLFGSRAFAMTAYPLLRFGRRALLRLLGRRLIPGGQVSPS
jgi:DCC1-like thiol-disulfide oxidoreductase